MGNTDTLKEQQVVERAPKEEMYSTLKREEKAKMTPFRYVQHHAKFLTKPTVLDKALKEDAKGNTENNCEHVYGKIYFGDLKAQGTPIGKVLEVLLSHKSHKEENGHWTRTRDVKAHKRDDDRCITHREDKNNKDPHEESERTLKGSIG